jgi:hypothetical protein
VPIIHSLNRLLPASLVVLHLLLLAWAVVGLVEWFLSQVPWPAISNALFPPWLLLLHWLAVLIASSLFLMGYVRRWSRTPELMIPAYAFMAFVCTIETVGFLTHSWRYLAMALELAAYAAIVLSLRRVPALASRFGRSISPQAARRRLVGAGP